MQCSKKNLCSLIVATILIVSCKKSNEEIVDPGCRLTSLNLLYNSNYFPGNIRINISTFPPPTAYDTIALHIFDSENRITGRFTTGTYYTSGRYWSSSVYDTIIYESNLPKRVIRYGVKSYALHPNPFFEKDTLQISKYDFEYLNGRMTKITHTGLDFNLHPQIKWVRSLKYSGDKLVQFVQLHPFSPTVPPWIHTFTYEGDNIKSIDMQTIDNAGDSINLRVVNNMGIDTTLLNPYASLRVFPEFFLESFSKNFITDFIVKDFNTTQEIHRKGTNNGYDYPKEVGDYKCQ